MSVSRRSFLAGATALAATPVRALAAQPAPFATATTIGVCAPFTGDRSKLGEQLANGVRQACDDANHFGGTLNRSYIMRTFDDQDLLAEGIVTAGFACDDLSVIAVIGHLSGHITEAAAKIYATHGLSLIVPASTFDRITEDGLPNVLRLPTKDFSEGRLAGKYVVDNWKPKQLVACFQDGDYGADVVDGFLQQMDANKISAAQVQFSYDKPKFPETAAKAMASKPDVIFLAGNLEDMGLLVRELRTAGFNGKFCCSKGFFQPDTLTKYGTALGDDVIISTPLPPLELAPSIFLTRQNFEIRYGPGSFNYLSAFGYAAAQVAIAGIQRSGANDRIALLRQFELPAPYTTVVGNYQFLPSGDALEPNIYFYGVRGGKFRYETAAVQTQFLAR